MNIISMCKICSSPIYKEVDDSRFSELCEYCLSENEDYIESLPIEDLDHRYSHEVKDV